MTNATPCEECQAIAEELRNAFAEMPPRLKDEYRADGEAFRRMIGGTEEDVERAEGMAGEFRQSGWSDRPEGRYPRIQKAFRRMVMHRFRTGHGVPLDK
jgi:hypothetical protein